MREGFDERISLYDIFNLRKEGLSYEQIGQRLGTSGQVIKNKLRNAAEFTRTGEKKRKYMAVFSEEETAELVKNYSTFAMGVKSAMKDENAGRARAANLHVMQCIGIGQQVDVDDINSLYAAWECYVKLCVENDLPMTLATACLALGQPVSTLKGWRSGQSRTLTPEYKTFAEGVVYAVQAGIEACMAAGIINPVLGIWWEKSHFGMIEAQREEAKTAEPLGEKRSAEDILADYAGVELPD